MTALVSAIDTRSDEFKARRDELLAKLEEIRMEADDEKLEKVMQHTVNRMNKESEPRYDFGTMESLILETPAR